MTSKSALNHAPVDREDRTVCRVCGMTISHVDQLREPCAVRLQREFDLAVDVINRLVGKLNEAIPPTRVVSVPDGEPSELRDWLNAAREARDGSYESRFRRP